MRRCCAERRSGAPTWRTDSSHGRRVKSDRLFRKIRQLACSSACLFALAASGAAASAADRPGAPALNTASGQLAAQILLAGDHRERPFAVVDKRAATIAVYSARGLWIGTSAALLGQALGDLSMPGVGLRTARGQLRSSDMTTKAGRFQTEPGLHVSGDPVVWIDYDDALAIHRVRAGPQRADRVNRLAQGSAAERRVSAGCVVVSAAFFDQVIAPVLGRARGVVYVMPEGGLWQAMWPDLAGAGG